MLTRARLGVIAGLLLSAVIGATASVASAAPAMAACPAGESITVTAPTAAAPTTVSVAVAPPLNLKPAKDAVADSYHLHYFVDIDPATVVQSGQAVPSGNPKIIHSAATTQDIGALTNGRHTVWVVLGDVGHVVCTPMVVGSVSFDVTGAALPATGTGSSNSGGMGGAPLAVLVVGIALAAGGVALGRRPAA